MILPKVPYPVSTPARLALVNESLNDPPSMVGISRHLLNIGNHIPREAYTGQLLKILGLGTPAHPQPAFTPRSMAELLDQMTGNGATSAAQSASPPASWSAENPMAAALRVLIHEAAVARRSWEHASDNPDHAELQPLLTQIASTLRYRGVMSDNYRFLEGDLHTLGARQNLDALATALLRMLAAVEMAEHPGTQWIEVIATDASGPHVVLLFPVEIGREPPRAWIGTRRSAEDWITDPVAAEAYAHRLLDEDRARFGLPELEYDEVLAAVARRHSAEMAQTGEIAHVSTTTGTVADRLESAGFQASFAAENIARSSTIADAQEGLMRSPGHRAAILSSDVTHVGIGIVSMNVPETGIVHYITQVFARPRFSQPSGTIDYTGKRLQ